MAKVGFCGNCCMYMSLVGGIFLVRSRFLEGDLKTTTQVYSRSKPSDFLIYKTFITYLAYVDPQRIHVIHPGEEGEEADHKISSSGSATMIAALVRNHFITDRFAVPK
jgi:hypothetical protein